MKKRTKMRTFKSETFKTEYLLQMVPKEKISIICQNYRDTDSKAAACRLRWKRSEEQFKGIGINRLMVAIAGNSVIVEALTD